MSPATHTALQSNSNPKGGQVTAEGLLVDGVMHYEAGDVHKALARWREVLVIDPAHSVASRYTQFVETHFQVTATSSLAEVQAAQTRVRRGLVGEPAPVAQQSMLVMPGSEAAALLAAAGDAAGDAAGAAPTPPSPQIPGTSAPRTAQQQPAQQQPAQQQPAQQRPAQQQPAQRQHAPTSASGVASEDPTLWASLPSSAAVVEVVAPAAEEDVTAPPKPAPLPVSEIARRAISGPAGPNTQADGLSIQALSRQLSELHRSGKYEQAVATARELLEKDPQHAVARRYIEEYNRQKQAALTRQRAARQARGEGPEPSSSPSSPSAAPMRTASYSNAGAPSTLSYASDAEDAPTAAPVEVAPPAALLPEDLTRTPRVLMPIDQISWREFDHRAGFFVSQVDGSTSYDDLIAISGMSRDEAIALLTKLIQRGVIGV